MMASVSAAGSATSCRRLADRPRRIRADKVHDLPHRRAAVEHLSHVVGALCQGTFRREQQPVGAAQFVDLVRV